MTRIGINLGDVILAMLVVPSNAGTPLAIRQAHVAAGSLGMYLTVVGVERAEDLDSAFTTIERLAVDTLYVFVEGLLYNSRSKLLDFATRTRLPTCIKMAISCVMVDPSDTALCLARTIRLRPPTSTRSSNGAKPSELPVEQSARYELAINLKTASILGLTIPPTILATADEIVE